MVQIELSKEQRSRPKHKEEIIDKHLQFHKAKPFQKCLKSIQQTRYKKTLF